MASPEPRPITLTAYHRVILGFKYCLRTRRLRQQQQQQQQPNNDVMAIDLITTPRPQRHRRRREKKLMTIDEVNDKFPLIKYRKWRSNRARKGLSASGGISAAPSRAPSIKGPTVETIEDVDCPDSFYSTYSRPSDENEQRLPEMQQVGSTESDRELGVQTSSDAQPRVSFSVDQPRTDGLEKGTAELNSKSSFTHSIKSIVVSSSEVETHDTKHSSSDEDEEEDDDKPIRHAVHADMHDTPGDTCAVCLDAIDDDDDVRGLTCDHTFHASCIDPWLTTRRACCPLCKADYYIPKPKPEGNEEPEEAARPPRGRNGASRRERHHRNGNNRSNQGNQNENHNSLSLLFPSRVFARPREPFNLSRRTLERSYNNTANIDNYSQDAQNSREPLNLSRRIMERSLNNSSQNIQNSSRNGTTDLPLPSRVFAMLHSSDQNQSPPSLNHTVRQQGDVESNTTSGPGIQQLSSNNSSAGAETQTPSSRVGFFQQRLRNLRRGARRNGNGPAASLSLEEGPNAANGAPIRELTPRQLEAGMA
ncbi:hypothetical protein KEM55_003432 [Ascosphaera atra]|nr:hypothetical protein KEM55_003432 [Ascosphaera atra]